MRRGGVAAVLAAGAIAACSMADMPGPDEGAVLFAENCAMCHGPDARGTGELANEIRAELGRKPSDLTVLTRGNKGVFPRAEVLSYIDGNTRGRLPEQNMPAALISLSFRNLRDDGKFGTQVAFENVPDVLLAETWRDYHDMADKGSGFDPDWQKKAGL